MRLCASAKRPGQESTWIEDEMINDYSALHHIGIAHSIEAFIKNEKVGGLWFSNRKNVFWRVNVSSGNRGFKVTCKLINISTTRDLVD